MAFAMAKNTLSLLVFSLAIFITLDSNPIVEATGFSVDLIHVRPNNAVRRMQGQALTDSVPAKNIDSDLIAKVYHHLIPIFVGTPPVQQYVIMDSGDNKTWVSCKPCIDCHHPPQALMFDPEKSSTYNANCDINGNNNCAFETIYADQSNVHGVFARETFTFGNKSVKFPDFVFGCSHKTSDGFPQATGLAGFGRGPLSFISQLQDVIKNKFSYCLSPPIPDPDATEIIKGKMQFGDEAAVSGPDVVTTALVEMPNDPKGYYVTLEGFRIGDKTYPLPKVEKGNMLLDSGTTTTDLTPEMWEVFSVALKEAGVKLEDRFNGCWDGAWGATPDITFRFSGADVVLENYNLFYMRIAETGEWLVCPNMGKGKLAILGDYGQQDFKVSYDLNANTVSFLRTDCTSQ